MRLSRFTIVLLFGAVVSALWLFLASRYVAVQIGWENLFFLLPHELGAFLAGVFMPLAFLWLAFVAHSIEVWLVAIGFFIIAQFPSIGGISAVTGPFSGSFAEFLYYSTVSYTSLGIGDLYPTGVLRLLTGVEALVGLAMIAWTGSFTYLAMEKFWSLHRTRTD